VAILLEGAWARLAFCFLTCVIGDEGSEVHLRNSPVIQPREKLRGRESGREERGREGERSRQLGKAVLECSFRSKITQGV
jgi:hypothetical protein